MRANGQQAQQIFRTKLRHQEGPRRAVQRGKEHQPARPGCEGQSGQKRCPFRHMFNHFQRNHGIVTTGFGQILGPALAVINGKPACFGMGAGRFQGFRRRIHAGDFRPEPRQGFRGQAGPTAHIQNPEPRQGRSPARFAAMGAGQSFGNPANAHWVHPVQRLHRAIRVPPARGQSVKFGDFRPKRRCFRQGDALSSPDPL